MDLRVKILWVSPVKGTFLKVIRGRNDYFREKEGGVNFFFSKKLGGEDFFSLKHKKIKIKLFKKAYF